MLTFLFRRLVLAVLVCATVLVLAFTLTRNAFVVLGADASA